MTSLKKVEKKTDSRQFRKTDRGTSEREYGEIAEEPRIGKKRTKVLRRGNKVWTIG